MVEVQVTQVGRAITVETPVVIGSRDVTFRRVEGQEWFIAWPSRGVSNLVLRRVYSKSNVSVPEGPAYAVVKTEY